MVKFIRGLSVVLLGFSIQVAFAQEQGSVNAELTAKTLEKTPEVGKHVMANMDASSMILSLLMVLALIIISALVLKRFNLTQQNTSQLKVVASLSLGAKERIVVVEVASQQLVLGVTSQQITLIERLAEPIVTATESSLPMTSNVLAFLQKANNKQSK